MSIEKITLHVERSEDGETEFARVADILDYLATLYSWHPYVHGFLTTRALDARQTDRVMAREIPAPIGFTLVMAREHLRSYPKGCPVGQSCDVCVAAGRYK